MSFNIIDTISAGEIASVISNNMLEHLNLNDCSLQDHAVVAIADALVKINSLVYSATTASHNRQPQRLEMLFIVIMQ